MQFNSVGFGFGKAVQVINADGTCPTTILSGLNSMYLAAGNQQVTGDASRAPACQTASELS